MKRLGFYLSGAQPVERVIPLIAAAALKQGQRMLVVAEEGEFLDRLDRAMWEEKPLDFLAHGRASDEHADRQPVLLSAQCEASNGAQLLALADGQWRDEAEQFNRVLLFFEDNGRAAARETWRQFDGRNDIEREFFELAEGKWTKRQ